ncbi:GDSL-like lipase/acylhydrolase [Secundilactobacillus pentosiphilus]|uniref:GDSL-like lipase/acylhydrolase n=1 Tax=Secundilactobacillus pentosiphilus TaxID=1714682 RepID=A0A1Z5IVA8_9LACO|nr:SGNH/GDSL hydrolase family protein [Secundilactobacillus pentosiphilus]GAX05371.1 GDSL-like lipase/acylhydrolase [Secundilactobacillus pentosiphilus]
MVQSLVKDIMGVIDITPTNTSVNWRGNTWFTGDLNTDVMKLQVIRNGAPVMLSDNTTKAIMHIISANKNYDNTVTLSVLDAANGIVGYTLTKEQNYPGSFTCQVALTTDETSQRAITTSFSFTLNTDTFSNVNGDDVVKLYSSFWDMYDEVLDLYNQTKDQLDNDSGTLEQMLDQYIQKYSDKIDTYSDQLQDTIKDYQTWKTLLGNEQDIWAALNSRPTYAELKHQIGKLSSGTPKYYPSIQAIQAAFPNGDDGMYLSGADNHVYGWDRTTSKWVDCGIYQGKALDVYPNVGIVSSGTFTIDLLNKHVDLRAGTLIERVGLPEIHVPVDSGVDLVNIGNGVDYIVYDEPTNVLTEVSSIAELTSTEVVLNAIADGQTVFPYNRHTTVVFNSAEMLAPTNRAANIGDAIYVDWDQQAISIPKSTIIESTDNRFYTVTSKDDLTLDFSGYKTKGVDFMLIYDTLGKTFSLQEIADQDYTTTNQGFYSSQLVLAIVNAAGLKFIEHGSNIVIKPFGESKQGNATILQGTLTIDSANKTINFSDDFILGIPQAGRFQSIDSKSNLTYEDKATGSSINALFYHLTLTERSFYVDVYPHDRDDFRILTFWNGKAFGIDDLDHVVVDGVGNGGRGTTDSSTNWSLQELSTQMYSKDKPAVKIANLGDSTYQITGTSSTDGRWSDLLQPILQAETGNPNITVVNGGFSGKSIQWIHDNFNDYFGAGKQFDGVQFVILGMGLNNATQFYNLDVIKGITQDVIQKIRALGMSVCLATTQANNLTTLSDRQEWYMYAAENAMRKELAHDLNLQLLDLNAATQAFLQHSHVKNSDITFDGLHFAPRGHQFEADWFEDQLLTRAMTITDDCQVDPTLQNTKSDAPQEWVVDNPDFKDGFKTKFQTTKNTADTLILDTLIMNMNTTPKELVAYADAPNGAYVLVNGAKYPLNDGKTVLLSYAEMAMYHIQIMSGTNASIDLEGVKFEA